MTVSITKISFLNDEAEVHYGHGQIFHAYRHGGDLNDLDELLRYLCPDIDFNKINFKAARDLERKLYRILSLYKTKSTASPVLKSLPLEREVLLATN